MGDVAVISTCYNQEEIIVNALQSVVDQTVEDVYHVIADDGSSDSSVSVLAEWEAQYDHIRVVECTNRNCAGAFNAALLNVPPEAEYVITLAGDDWLAPNYVEECRNVFYNQRHDIVDMVVTGMKRVDYPGQNGALEMPPQHQPSQEELWEWRQTYAWAVSMFRKDALLSTGGFHQATEGDCDWDMWVDLEARGYQFGFTDKTWFYYRYVHNSLNRVKTPEIWDAHRAEMMRHHGRDTMPGQEFS